jgi:multidrug efflux system membrane fusion protein
MKRSFIFAVPLALATALWVGPGQIGSDESASKGPQLVVKLPPQEQAPLVRVRPSRAEQHAVVDLLRGRTEANRLVEIKSETDGRLAELPVDDGTPVKAGDVIARLSPGDRPARLAEAKALRAQRKVEFDADTKLSQKGFRAETQLAATQAELEAAEAAVKIAEVELSYTTIRAPFDGVIDSRLVEIGDYIDRGEAIARLVELDPMIIVTQVNERYVKRLSVGAPGQARLMGEETVTGTIRHISAVADEATRTFRVELEVPNPDRAISAGMTAEIALPLSQIAAHHISPAVLTLADNGEIGVKTVDAENRVVFHAVNIVDTDSQGMWITGLPAEVNLITVGQEYVGIGETVRTVSESEIQDGLEDLSS